MGLFIKWVSKTRDELTACIRRCSHGEIPESRLNGHGRDKLKLKSSPLGWRFHLYDALGSERVERYCIGGSDSSGRTQQTFLRLTVN